MCLKKENLPAQPVRRAHPPNGENEVCVLENHQLLPFERNRYYVGKLLTSADFQAEQAYGIQKRRFLNELMFGYGVVCGLGVYSLDDQSVMVDSGVAMDGCGREIAVASAVVRKLSAVKGFEELETGRAILCLRYREENVHPVYAVKGQEAEEGYECNRIREEWEFFLKDEAALPLPAPPESEFFSSAVLFEDEEYIVTLAVPAAASCGFRVRMDLTVKAKGDGVLPFGLDTVIQTPAFLGDNGEHELHIHLEEIAPGPGEMVRRSYWLTAQGMPAPDSVLIAGADGTRISIGDRRENLKDNFMMRVAVEDAPPEELVARAIGRISLESRELAGRADFVPLARVLLQRTKNAYLIEKLEENGVKRYVQTAAAAGLRTEYAAYYASPEQTARAAAAQEVRQDFGEDGERYRDPIYATGVCEIPMGGARRGQIVRSDEILHGLGRGNVLVQVGFEYLTEDMRQGGQSRNTIYGDPGLFSEEAPPITMAATAVKVLNDRGSFVAAARLEQDAAQAVMLLRWVAVKLPAGEEGTKLQRMAGKSIAAEQPTVVLATRESHFFNVKFKNMEPCTLTYELTEPDSGDITSDGIYTAPGREGVYEIRISCAEMPMVSTYAYAVVKKRTAEEEEPARQK